MKIRTITLLASGFYAWMLAASAADPLKDPRLRDEDLAATAVSVEVTRNANGMYVYTYDVEAPLENTGQIRAFILDIACGEGVDPKGFDPKDYPSNARPSASEDGKHIPVAIDAPRGEAAAFGINAANSAHWMVVLKPGQASRGLTLVSPYPPGSRIYSLRPSIRYGEEQWDYSDIEEDDPTIPWIDDWTVTGLTTGPACPGQEYPDNGGDGPGDDRFAGSPFAGQSDQLNELLTYSTPLKDQFHLPAGSRELEMTIHYHESIDPRTFRVSPENNQLCRLFTPKPGTSETVRLPLKPGKNRIELQVQTQFVPPGQQRASGSEAAGRGGVSMDRDVFVIRVPADDEAPGKGGKGSRGN
jgi:hypothetical protein